MTKAVVVRDLQRRGLTPRGTGRYVHLGEDGVERRVYAKVRHVLDGEVVRLQQRLQVGRRRVVGHGRPREARPVDLLEEVHVPYAKGRVGAASGRSCPRQSWHDDRVFEGHHAEPVHVDLIVRLDGLVTQCWPRQPVDGRRVRHRKLEGGRAVHRVDSVVRRLAGEAPPKLEIVDVLVNRLSSVRD